MDYLIAIGGKFALAVAVMPYFNELFLFWFLLLFYFTMSKISFSIVSPFLPYGVPGNRSLSDAESNRFFNWKWKIENDCMTHFPFPRDFPFQLLCPRRTSNIIIFLYCVRLACLRLHLSTHYEIYNVPMDFDTLSFIFNFQLSIFNWKSSPRQSWTADLYIISVAL